MVFLTKIYAREVSHREKSLVVKTGSKLNQILFEKFNMIHNSFFHYLSSATQCTNSGRLHIRSYFEVL